MSKLNTWNDRIWNFFASVDLAVALFIVISIAASIGTVIPQQTEPEPVIRFFTKFMSIETAAKVYEFVSLLDLNNVYHSWWFTFLLFMFSLNLIVCSIDRLPGLLKSYKISPLPIPKDTLEKMPLKKTITLGDKNNQSESVEEILRKKGFSTYTFQINNETQIHAKKWTKARLAVYLTHLSIIIILAGALIGTFFGFRGHMNIPEGGALEFAISDEGKAIPLNFQVKCEKFEVEYYENSAVPKAYRSYIRIFEDGKPVKVNGKEEVLIEVNEPFSYRGISFYQATYGFQPTENAEFRFTFIDKAGNKMPVKAKLEEKFTLPNSTVKASVIDFSPALGIDEQGRLFNLTTEMINPAVLVLFEEGNKKDEHWILKKIPETWETPYGTLKFEELWGAHFTGLQVRKDPGVPFIYIGSILMSIGLFISLFLRPIRFYVTVRQKDVIFYSPLGKGSFIVEKQIDDTIKRLKGDVA